MRGVTVTFPLGLLKLPASRLNVALHQRSDHLLPIRYLALFGSVTFALKNTHLAFKCTVLRGENMQTIILATVTPTPVKHTYHRGYWRIFILRITIEAAAESSKDSPGKEFWIDNEVYR